jgi:hypothetical protein
MKRLLSRERKTIIAAGAKWSLEKFPKLVRCCRSLLNALMDLGSMRIQLHLLIHSEQ